GGLRGRLRNYADALELFWIQYVVTYDKQEQRTLAQTLRGKLNLSRAQVAQTAGGLKAWLSALWNNVTATINRTGLNPSLSPLVPACLLLILATLFYLLYKRGFSLRRRARERDATGASGVVVVAFYERMLRALEARGLRRAGDQTPLEFALAANVPEALTITEAYHRVRYGARRLSNDEVARIENCLRKIEAQAEASTS
ncbi:MAG: DUF4129 domain-containing protein, partial [Pyrinomonadaceae bacterium]